MYMYVNNRINSKFKKKITYQLKRFPKYFEVAAILLKVY